MSDWPIEAFVPLLAALQVCITYIAKLIDNLDTLVSVAIVWAGWRLAKEVWLFFNGGER